MQEDAFLYSSPTAETSDQPVSDFLTSIHAGWAGLRSWYLSSNSCRLTEKQFVLSLLTGLTIQRMKTQWLFDICRWDFILSWLLFMDLLSPPSGHCHRFLAPPKNQSTLLPSPSCSKPPWQSSTSTSPDKLLSCLMSRHHLRSSTNTLFPQTNKPQARCLSQQWPQVVKQSKSLIKTRRLLYWSYQVTNKYPIDLRQQLLDSLSQIKTWLLIKVSFCVSSWTCIIAFKNW